MPLYIFVLTCFEMNAEACSYTVRLMRHRCSTYPDKFHQPGTSCSLAASPRRTMGTGKSFCPFYCPRCSVPEGMFVGDGIVHYLVLTQPAKVRGRLSADIGRLLLRVVSTKDFEFCFLSNKQITQVYKINTKKNYATCICS